MDTAELETASVSPRDARLQRERRRVGTGSLHASDTLWVSVVKSTNWHHCQKSLLPTLWRAACQSFVFVIIWNPLERLHRVNTLNAMEERVQN